MNTAFSGRILGALLLATAAAFTVPTPVEAAPAPKEAVKVYAFIAKRPDLTDEAFHAHWREPHARLAMKVPTILRYVQNHAVGRRAVLPGLKPLQNQGIATIWVGSVAALGEIAADPLYQEVHEDELNLLDRDKLTWFITEEHVVVRGRGAADIDRVSGKALLFLRRAKDTDADAFLAAVKSAVNAARAFAPGERLGYALPAAGAYPAGTEPPYDAVIEIYAVDAAALDRAWARHAPRWLSRLEAVIDTRASRGFYATEERKRWPELPR